MSKPSVFPGKGGVATSKIVGKITESFQGSKPEQQRAQSNIPIRPSQISGAKDVIVLSGEFGSASTPPVSTSTLPEEGKL
jgi:hypothetical protein